MKANNSKKNMFGFTIVELLIATVVFSMILLLVTTGILEVTSVYFKGVTESNTQTVALNIMNAAAQAIQFNGGSVAETPSTGITPGNSYSFCAGNERFSYRPGYQLVSGTPTGDQTNYSIVVDSNGSASCPHQDMAGSPTGKELMGQDMRLSAFSVTCAIPGGGCNSPPAGVALSYRIHVRVVYGDDDLLKSIHNPTGPPAPSSEPDAECASSQSGDQFCAESDLSTVVEMRVQG